MNPNAQSVNSSVQHVHMYRYVQDSTVMSIHVHVYSSTGSPHTYYAMYIVQVCKCKKCSITCIHVHVL